MSRGIYISGVYVRGYMSEGYMSGGIIFTRFQVAIMDFECSTVENIVLLIETYS